MNLVLVDLEKNINNAMVSLNDTKRIEVAVGVVFNHLGQVLIAKRPWYKGECWEFPGGKIEPGETDVQALKRELFEEVGIVICGHQPWLVIEHDYVDKAVRLKVHKITAFEGEAKGVEGQKIKWLAPQQLTRLCVPEANRLIVKALASF